MKIVNEPFTAQGRPGVNWPFAIFWTVYGALVLSIVWKGVLFARRVGLL